MEELLFKAEHSLVEQSLNATEAKVPTNGDGFGVGWFADRNEPGLYREIMPAWNDCNLQHIAHQIRTKHFFAHVRASTGTATSRDNCHPFAVGNWMFMHNGQIGDYSVLRRQLEALIPDSLYQSRRGTTDSEALFLILLGAMETMAPEDAICWLVERVVELQREAAIRAPFRCTFALTDGSRSYFFRYASDNRAPSLYLSKREDSLLVLSEPLSEDTDLWEPIEPGVVIMARGHEIVGSRSLGAA
ncbi:class II glutamine amidotransferase [Kiloniella sp. b19]|uniref:class II glutamine amidotransferase n=1 Tax=Kiloniella sp. GXU_MW_B19 TaxID=3141326 RepID=UPI0031D337D2